MNSDAEKVWEHAVIEYQAVAWSPSIGVEVKCEITTQADAAVQNYEVLAEQYEKAELRTRRVLATPWTVPWENPIQEFGEKIP